MVGLRYIQRIVEAFVNSEPEIDSLEVSTWSSWIRVTRAYSQKTKEHEANFYNAEKDSIFEKPEISKSPNIEYILAPVSGVLHYHPDYSPDHATESRINADTKLGVIDKRLRHQDLKAKVSGTIEKFLVREGERVQKSQLLIRVRLD